MQSLKRKPTILNRSPSFSNAHLLVFALIFAITAGIITWRTLAANPNLSGDINNDNVVDVTDLSILLTNYNSSNASADLNSDGNVNIIDLSILLSHYGQVLSSPVINFSANSSSIIAGQSTTLTWSSTNATTCTASKSWAGNKPTAGSTTVGPLINNSSFSLSCTGGGGTTQASVPVSVGSNTTHQYGTLQTSTSRISTNFSAGIRLAHIDLGWDQYEPNEGTFNSTYINSVKSQITSYRNAGMQVVLGFGIQQPPSWVFSYPNSRYVNQFDQQFTSATNGKNTSNMVFNDTLRQKQENYIKQVFSDLGSNFYAVRIGGGWYGELNYPDASFGGSNNNYWAYDNIAQGKTAGLPSGISANPVPGWIPGSASTNHTNASQFINWYLNSLKDYHDWQIKAYRKYYTGPLAMLYPSWGVRPGQLSAAVNVDLNGSTSTESNGELQRGFDYARYVSGINDPNVFVYTTWLNASNSGDGGTDQTQWSPIHYLWALASNNPLRLKTWGESSGANTFTEMQLCFMQINNYGLPGMMWAFEPELYGGTYASLVNYQSLISANP